MDQFDDLARKVIQDVADQHAVFIAFVVAVDQGFELLGKVDSLGPVHLFEVIDRLGQQLLQELDLRVG